MPDLSRHGFLRGAGATAAGIVGGKVGGHAATDRAHRVTILSGTHPPGRRLGQVGWFYVDSRTHELYGPKTGHGWGRPVSLIGRAGARGTPGAQGAQGYSVLNGTGPPAATLGQDGDFYIDTASTQLYGPRSGGVWGSPTPLTGLSLASAGLSETATLFVTADGSDSNSGLDWGSGLATIQHALGSLPSNGGIIEVGYGSFAGFIYDSDAFPGPPPAVTVRGRGIAHSTSVTDATVAPPGVHPTRITSEIVIDSRTSGGLPEDKWAPIRLEDLAVTGVDSTVSVSGATVTSGDFTIGGLSSTGGVRTGDLVTGSDGLGQMATVLAVDSSNAVTVDVPATATITGGSLTFTHPAISINGPNVLLRRIACDSNAGHGLVMDSASNTFFVRLDDCRFIGNGGHGMWGTPQTVLAGNSNWDGNSGRGMVLAPRGYAGAECTFVDCTFQRNHLEGAYVQCVGATFIGTQFEGNSRDNGSYGTSLSFQNGPITLIGCFFVGDSVEYNAFRVESAITVLNCCFVGHMSGTAIDVPYPGVPFYAVGNLCTSPETNFIEYNAPSGAPLNFPASQAAAQLLFGAVTGGGIVPQTLSSDGAVTIDAHQGAIQAITLGANATSSAIRSGVPGQELVLDWIQDAAGGRSYAWPPDCRFDSDTPPAASSNAGYRDRVTFVYDGALWWEKARSIAMR
jgi:hypothetical protein